MAQDTQPTSTVTPSRYNVSATIDEGHAVTFNTHRGKMVRLSHAMVEGALLAPTGTFPEVEHVLYQNGFLVDANANERVAANNMRDATLANDKTLSLIILPTEACNFRCRYCYESFLRGTMSKTVEENLVSYLGTHVQDLDLLVLAWFGGEPLMAVSTIERISRAAIWLCHKHKVNYISAMTTNGYTLDAAMMDRLLRLGVTRYQVTLDGLSPQQRPSSRDQEWPRHIHANRE